MQTFWIILGLLILLLTFWDFFHTTVSGNGFGKISLYINKFLSVIILKINSKTLFNYSGFIHVMVTIFSLFIFLLLGAFLIFASGDQMVVNEISKLPASLPQRFYYTCYLLSTAGFGDFVPGNELSNFFSSIFSFSGFILLTTAVTYIISVINSILIKKELAMYISSLGENLDELYVYFTKDNDLTTVIEQGGTLRKMISKNTNSFNTFPITRYFLTREKKYALVLQLASLYEVLTVLKRQTEPNSMQRLKISRITTSIEYYLQWEEQSPLTYTYDEKYLKELRSFWEKYNLAYEGNSEMDKAMSNALRKTGWNWEAVYPNGTTASKMSGETS